MAHQNTAEEDSYQSDDYPIHEQTLPNPASSPPDRTQDRRIDALERNLDQIKEDLGKINDGIMLALNEIKEKATPNPTPVPSGHAASLSSLKDLTKIALDLSQIGEKGRAISHEQGVEVGELRAEIANTFQENEALKSQAEKIQEALEAAKNSKSADVKELVDTLGPIANGLLDAIAPRKA